MEAAFSLGVYSRHATGRGGRLSPPPRRCPRGMAAGRAGLPGPHEPPPAGTEPGRQPGRRRRRPSLPPVPAALPRAAAAAPPRPPLRSAGGSGSPSPPRAPPAVSPGRGGGAGLGTCSVGMPKKERRARKMQTHRWKDEGVCRFRVCVGGKKIIIQTNKTPTNQQQRWR